MNIRSARVVAMYTDDGTSIPESDWPHKKGTIIQVKYRGKYIQSTKYPWVEVLPNGFTGEIFRDTELEFIDQKEIDLNEYL